uniref:Set2 Rpb1 interacting domain-containing protein n=1 Tax=Parascaris equorum TaxID=6256 RepID=A0A914RHF2_PAREQ
MRCPCVDAVSFLGLSLTPPPCADLGAPPASQQTPTKKLALLKERRAARKKEAEAKGGIPPPPPPEPPHKKSNWVQATTEEGTEGDDAADTTSDHSDPRAVFKALIAKHVAGILEPIRKTKFSSSDDYKYVLRKLTHTVLEKETKRIGGGELKVTESVKEKARRYVNDYIARLGEGQYSRKNKQHNTY